MQLIWFDSLEELCSPPEVLWNEHLENLDQHILMKPKFDWEAKKIGAGPTPIQTVYQ